MVTGRLTPHLDPALEAERCEASFLTNRCAPGTVVPRAFRFSMMPVCSNSARQHGNTKESLASHVDGFVG
ncbi:MAG: hypothetical protein CV090_00760 [Nitrospira sp. WS238]|nr:hypothetical protein [Nitrospira sp. WS238]